MTSAGVVNALENPEVLRTTSDFDLIHINVLLCKCVWHKNLASYKWEEVQCPLNQVRVFEDVSSAFW